MTRTQFYYKNHRGVTELRTIEPISLQYVASPHLEYGYAPGWFLHGLDFTERDGVAREGQARSFSLDHIQMEGFAYGTKGGAAAFQVLLDGIVPKKPKAIVQLNSETGGEPVNSHGGLAQSVRWELFVAGELIWVESARFAWKTDFADRNANTLLAAAPPQIKDLYMKLSAALDAPDEVNEHATDALAYAMTNFREPDEFGEGARVGKPFSMEAIARKAGVDLGGNPLPVDAVQPIPPGAYWSPNQTYSGWVGIFVDHMGRNKDERFREMWLARKDEFPLI